MEKLAVIAGGTSGVGKKTALDLAKQGVAVILIARNPQKGEQVRQEIIAKSNNQAVTFMAADLSTKAGIKTLAKSLLAQHATIDILVSSVGIMQKELKATADGYDQNVVLNYLTHFWLIEQLLPALKQAKQGLILLVGALPFAVKHAKVALPTFDLPTGRYNHLTVTTQTLSARILLVKKLSQLLAKTKVTVNIFHPGYVTDSNLGTQMSLGAKVMGQVMGQFSLKNPTVGADLALDEKYKSVSGQFFNDHGEEVALKAAYSNELANQLWLKSVATLS